MQADIISFDDFSQKGHFWHFERSFLAFRFCPSVLFLSNILLKTQLEGTFKFPPPETFFEGSNIDFHSLTWIDPSLQNIILTVCFLHKKANSRTFNKKLMLEGRNIKNILSFQVWEFNNLTVYHIHQPNIYQFLLILRDVKGSSNSSYRREWS